MDAKIEAIDRKIENIRRSIEDGLADTAWADARLTELKAERSALESAREVSGEPPQIDRAAAASYRDRLTRLFKHRAPAEKKRLIEACVEGIGLGPEDQEVIFTRRIPEPVANRLVAGAPSEWRGGRDPNPSGLALPRCFVLLPMLQMLHVRSSIRLYPLAHICTRLEPPGQQSDTPGPVGSRCRFV